MVFVPLPSAQALPGPAAGDVLPLLVPLYVAAMGAEALLGRGRHYRLADSVASLSAGICSMLAASLTVSLTETPFQRARTFFESVGLVLPWQFDSWQGFLVIVLMVDFFY